MKRAIALFLALVFVFTLVPVSALAAEETIVYNVKYTDGTTEIPDSAFKSAPKKQFERKYDSAATPPFIGNATEVLDVALKDKVVTAATATATGITPAPAFAVSTAKLTINVEVSATTSPIDITVAITSRDPELKLGDTSIAKVTDEAGATILDTTTPKAIAAGTPLVAHVNASTGKTFVGLSGVSATDIAIDPATGNATAKFVMPSGDTTIAPEYGYKVTLKAKGSGETLDEKVVVPGKSVSLDVPAAKAVKDEIATNAAVEPAASGATYDSATAKVAYTLPTGAAADVVLTLESSKLQKLTLSGCVLVSVTSAADPAKEGVYKGSAPTYYVKAGERVEVQASVAATSALGKYTWQSTGGIALPATMDTMRNVYFGMPAAEGTVTNVPETALSIKLNLEDCEIVPESVSGAYRVEGTSVYVADGTTLEVRAKPAANSYTWKKNGTDMGYDGRTISITAGPGETTYTAAAITQYKVMQYDPDGTLPASGTTYHIKDAEVKSTAPATYNGHKFVRWSIIDVDKDGGETLNTEIDAADLKKNPITFTMPEKDVKLKPVYETTLELTEAYVTAPASVVATVKEKTDADGRIIRTYTVDSGTSVTIAPVASKNDGSTYTFVKWNSNSTRISSNTSPYTFIMPPEDVTVGTGWQTYTLTVKRFVNSGKTETFTLRPGEYVTLDAQAPTGGTRFNYWTHADDMWMTVNTATELMNQPNTERITIMMPAKDAWVTANYLPVSDTDYTLTGAHIELKNEPTRYYALLEYFDKGSMEVVYYGGFENINGVKVDPSQLRCRVLDPVTGAVVCEDGGYFGRTGDFILEITFYVADKLMAKPLITLNTASTYIHVYNKRPEYVVSYAPNNVLHNNVYYGGETTTSVDKDGLVVNLISADHVTEGPHYFTERTLAPDEYKLTAYNKLGTQYTLGTEYDLYDIPSFADVQAAADKGLAGYKKATVKVNGVDTVKYYMQLGIEYYDESQMDSVTGKPLLMKYLPGTDDAIWIEVRDSSSVKLSLENAKTNKTPVASTDDKFVTKTATWPSYSWEMNYSKVALERTFDLSVLGSEISSVSVENEDSTVAYVTRTDSKDTTTPFEYRLIPRTTGVTKITFYVRGTDRIDVDKPNEGDPTPSTTMVTLEITVKDDVGGVIPMDSLTKLNKESAILYVGTKTTLYPSEYSPNTANTTMRWSVAFKDDKQPYNASSYIKVDPITGTVEALKYTDRTVLVYAQAANFSGTASTADGTTGKFPTPLGKDVAICEITVAEIPVYSMTLYPAETVIFRKATSKLSCKVYPEAASDQKIKWTSSNSNIASVDEEGNVTANMLGEATITATSNSNNTVYKTCKVTVKESVLLTEILLNRNSATLGVGDSTPLSVYFTPANATTKTVTWETSDPSVATVNSSGKVFGISEGTAIITASANDGSGKKAVCVVSVSTIVASAVVLNKQTLALIEDETEQLKATIYPTNVSNSGIVWSSNNDKVAVVDADGVVTGTGGGSAVITATAKDASTRYADCVVVVTAKIPATALSLNLSSFDLLLNDTTTLTASLSPANATDKVVWTSSNANVASVDEKGKVSGVATGEATITATAGARSVSIKVNVVTKLYSSGTVVNCKRRVNVRQKASGASASLGYAYLGDTYKVIDKDRSWYEVQYNANTQGYIWASYLNASLTSAGYVSSGAVGSSTTTPAPGTTPTPVVTAKTLTITNCETCINVRSGAGTTFSKVGFAYLNETFTYTAVSADGWYTIQFNGSPAYVSGSFVKVNG